MRRTLHEYQAWAWGTLVRNSNAVNALVSNSLSRGS